MNLHRVAALILQALFIVGLTAAYLGAAAGLMGYIDARMVSFVALCGAGLAFIATLVYFAASDLGLRRRPRAG